MHDNQGRELKRGDFVLVPMIVDQVHPFADYCNVTLRTIQQRKPDGYHDVMTTNTHVIFRNRDGDENDMMFDNAEDLIEQYKPAPLVEPAADEQELVPFVEPTE